MFENENLQKHLELSSTIESEAVVTAEWNMNVPDNIQKLGNYRYRPEDTKFNALPNSFDLTDVAGYYTGATDSDVTIDYGFTDEDDIVKPLLFKYPKEKEKLYYSLEDCVKPFRPRSGINKSSFFKDKYFSHPNENMYLRPRYYMPTKDDLFKYWRSYRTESTGSTLNNANKEYGVSEYGVSGIHPITDANPFVVYKDKVPANRLVVKVQTNVGGLDQGPFNNGEFASLDDPFFGEANKTVPQKFKVQYLSENNEWIDAAEFDQGSTRDDGVSPVFDYDGYLSLEYGLIVPETYRNSFVFVKEIRSELELPPAANFGESFLLSESEEDQGTIIIYNGNAFEQFPARYGWRIGSNDTTQSTTFIKELVNPSYYIESNSNVPVYRDFVWIKGIRLVVQTMNTPNTPLELIELSPRLAANISDRVINYNVTKTLSDLTSSAVPVGNLVASIGNINIFDDNQAFNYNNAWNDETKTGSIVAKYLFKNVKFLFFDVIKNVENVNYYVPVKTLYTEGIPQVDRTAGTIAISLRDFYFYLESMKAPRILLTDVSLSQAVCILLDHVGFSNYIFKRLSTESDPIIPYFFIAPEQNVAEVLNQLALATQSAMFFDEYNNFVVMTKEYLLEDSGVREVNKELYGQDMLVDESGNKYAYLGNVYLNSELPTIKQLGAYLSFEDGGVYSWSDSQAAFVKVGQSQYVLPANIEAIASEDQKVYNAGTINYTARYIQRSYASLQQSLHVDKTWVYKPVLLWEVGGTQATRSSNNTAQEGYALAAMPLNTTLSENVPTVVNHQTINNVMDVGENAYWITRYKGLLYANGEIIKYDAVQYNVTGVGNVWISSNLEYQKYFSQIPFNGKIYPTGLIRIYSEPFFETIEGITKAKNGKVLQHGRGQFGTPIVNHPAGLSPYWASNDNVRGLNMQSDLLYTTEIEPETPETEVGAAGISNAIAQRSTRNGIIKNFVSSAFATETDVNRLKTTTAGTIQSSAFVVSGPTNIDTPRDFVTYVHKPLDGAYKHFGTRMRIIGKIEALGDRSQTPTGSMNYFNVAGTDPTQTISIGGGSGGISIVNPKTNNGYYFEIAALTSANIERYLEENEDGETISAIDNILFYKIKKNSSASGSQDKAIPEKLWGGIGNIVVDDGNFTGQNRFFGEQTPTVYDIAIEYVDVNENTRKFYLYINQNLVKVIVDEDPIPFTNPSIAPFVRGTSKLMFENLYALSKNYAVNTVFDVNTPISGIFGDQDQEVSASEALNKYALSGAIQQTYLSGIRSDNQPDYSIYFEEFGTIMREAGYFNIKYDRAYPAIYAKIAPTFNRLKGYTVSGFTADSYGAEFLVFNNTDTVLNLDETTGNYLRILGVTFTQDTTNSITVDDYLQRRGNLADAELEGNDILTSPYKFIEQYDKIKVSRLQYGTNEFSLDSPYIQSQDMAEDVLGWLIEKNQRPRKAIGIKVFSNATIQLGDIVTIDYKTNDGVDVIAPDSTRYVVYNIQYDYSPGGPSMTMYLSEV